MAQGEQQSTSTLPEKTSSTSSHHPSSTTIYPYSYETSKIVKTAVAAGVIVLALSALVLFFKITSWIRYHQRLRRQYYMASALSSEQRANAYEIAAWSDEPGTAPIGGQQPEKKSWKQKRKDYRTQKRGGANAHAVHEWEGSAA